MIVTGGGSRGEGTDIDTVGMGTVALNGVVVFAALSSIGGTECQVCVSIGIALTAGVTDVVIGGVKVVAVISVGVGCGVGGIYIVGMVSGSAGTGAWRIDIVKMCSL